MPCTPIQAGSLVRPGAQGQPPFPVICCTHCLSFPAGEHNDWHKQTAFELATRVPLIMKAPMKPQSADKHTTLFAELVSDSHTAPTA